MSSWIVTKWSSIWIRPVKRRLAASGLAHKTFSVAVFWLGDLLSGHLHQTANTMESGGISFLASASLSIARVKLSGAGNKAHYDSVSAWVDASFVVEFS